MYNLETVKEYIDDARTLLLDQIAPYRYSDVSLLVAFNIALLEGRRLRPDLFVYRHGNSVPSYSAITGEKVHIEPQFRKAFVYGLAAHALARDQEDVQDQRSNMFQSVMNSILTGLGGAPIGGGTPRGGPQQGGGMQLPSA
jgi:hypothetical protein